MAVEIALERRRFTIDEYEKMGQAGNLFVPAVGDRARVLVQMPIRIPPRSMPEPDLALLRPRSYRRDGARPADVFLVIEVADTSLAYDRVVKQRLYARAGIPEYWIVDTNIETVDVYRVPSGDAYAERRRTVVGETLTPLAFPDCVIPIDPIFH